jgi:hypothetical protein
MRRSLYQRRSLVAEAMRRFRKQRPVPAYQKVVFWIIILGTLLLVLDVVFLR